MGYTPLDRGILTSTLLKNGPDVVACWLLVLADTDRSGESGMTPEAAAGLLRMPDDRAEAAFAVLSGPDPKSRNKMFGGRRIVARPNGRWFVVSHEKYQWLASRAAATKRQAEYVARKKAAE